MTRVWLENLTVEMASNSSLMISTLELNERLLIGISSEQLEILKSMISHASNIIWITGGGLLNVMRPSFSLVLGLSRTLMLEQPSLRSVVVMLKAILWNRKKYQLMFRESSQRCLASPQVLISNTLRGMECFTAAGLFLMGVKTSPID